MRTEPETIAQRLLGLVCCGALVYMVYLSLGPDHTLDWPGVIAMLIVIGLLLGYKDGIVTIINSMWGN